MVLGDLLQGLYVLHSNNLGSFGSSCFSHSNNSCNTVVNGMTWHSRLGHLPLYKLKQLHIFYNTHVSQFQHCDICPQSRQQSLPFSKSSITSTKIFDLIHINTWGPYNTETYNGFKYFFYYS